MEEEVTIAPFLAKVNEFIINPLIILLMALALAIFLWGVVQFLINRDNPEKASQGKTHMIYGLLGLFIMVAVFGIMEIIVNTFGLQAPDGGSPAEFLK